MAVIPGQPFMSQYQTMLEKLIVHYHLSHCFHWNSLITRTVLSQEQSYHLLICIEFFSFVYCELLHFS